MKPGLAVLCLVAIALATPAEAGDPVIVWQETRTPVSTTKPRGVRYAVILRNVSASPVTRLRVTVELYDFFGKLLWTRTVLPIPASLAAGDTTTLTFTTPHLESVSQTRYRIGYGGAQPSRSRPRRRRGGRDPAGKG